MGVIVAACNNKRGGSKGGNTGDTGRVELGVFAANAGSAAQSFAPHTLDPSSYRIRQFVAGPADEMTITVKNIFATSSSNNPGQGHNALLFGTPDGSGPGVEITLANGAVGLAASGVVLNPVPVGHYDGIIINASRVVKFKGCIRGDFNAEAPVSGTVDGVSYTTDTLSAGMHQFCTIASKSLLNYYSGGKITGPVGTDANYEAQATPESVEIDLGNGAPFDGAGTLPTTADQVRSASFGFGLHAEFDVTPNSAVKLTMVVDLNRALQFWPNIAFLGSFPNADASLQHDPPGTSYFYNSFFGFGRSFGVFLGSAGTIEGYQTTSEYCGGNACVAGSPPNQLATEWITLLRGTSGAINIGFIAPNDANGGANNLITSAMASTTTAGTFRLSLGDFNNDGTTTEIGFIDGFRFKALADSEDSCAISYPLGGGAAGDHGPFPLWYTRRL